MNARGAGVAAERPGRALEPAELLYGRLLASAAAGGEPGGARFRLAGGHAHQLPVDRWLAPVDGRRPRGARAGGGARCSTSAAVPAVTSRRSPPPGHAGLGLDLSPVAVRLARARGADAILRSVFADVPHAGTWRTALLLDGNIGIGGAPAGAPRAGPRAGRPGRRGAGRDRPAGRADAAPARAARDAGRDEPVVRLGDGRRGRDRAARPRRGPRPRRAVRVPAGAGSRGWNGRREAAAGPLPARLLALAAARPVAHRGARHAAAGAGRRGGADRLPVPRSPTSRTSGATGWSTPTSRSRRRSTGRPGRRGCTRSRRACT